MKKEGSAVLIAMIVVSILGAVGFGVSKVAIMQLRLATINDAADSAYAAAEAGLEYGLYQASIDPDATISTASIGSQVVPASVGQSAINANPLTMTLTGSDETADVLMYHETYGLGGDNCQTTQVAMGLMDTPNGPCDSATNPLLVMQPDESFSFSKPYGAAFYIRAEPANLPIPLPPVDADKNIQYGAVELTGYDEFGNTIRHDLINLASMDRYLIMDPNRADAYHVSGYDPAARVTIRFYTDTRADFDTGNLYVSIRIKDTSGGLVPFDSGRTTVDVTGKVSGHERHLRAVLNRQTKQVIGIFDYALYTQDDLTQHDNP